VTPRRWYLSVNGSDAQLITSQELNIQVRFRNWCLAHGHKPPMAEKVHVFEEMIGSLIDKATKREDTLPFMQTDAGCIENLTNFFDIHIPNMVRSKGQEYLAGKIGDYVRLRMDINRAYFKWQSLKRFLQRSLNVHEKELDAMKMFISAKGGYQGEEGARDWFRWTYWVPLSLFNEGLVWKWLHPDEPESGGE
jgi:hypothetical protein